MQENVPSAVVIILPPMVRVELVKRRISSLTDFVFASRGDDVHLASVDDLDLSESADFCHSQFSIQELKLWIDKLVTGNDTKQCSDEMLLCN